RLAPEWFLGGEFAIDLAASKAALAGIGGQAEGRSRAKIAGAEERLAGGVIALANIQMGRGLRVVSVERGFDPRGFTRVAFAGAGPLHACELAAALSWPRVLVPRYPGVLSALGMAWADETRDLSSAAPALLEPETLERVSGQIDTLLASQAAALRAE